MDIFQDGIAEETFQVAYVRDSDGTGEMGVILKDGDIHEVGLNVWADLLTKLCEDAESPVVHIRPEINRSSFREEA